MKRICALVLTTITVSACAIYPPLPPQPHPPAPVRKGETVPPPARRIVPPPAPTLINLPNGNRISVIDDTKLLSSCAVFGIPANSKKPAICVAVPSSMADGRGGGSAQDGYANLLRGAGYTGRGLPLAYRGKDGCRQHVMLSTFPATIQREDNWKSAKDYVLFMEFTPMTCPE